MAVISPTACVADFPIHDFAQIHHVKTASFCHYCMHVCKDIWYIHLHCYTGLSEIG